MKNTTPHIVSANAAILETVLIFTLLISALLWYQYDDIVARTDTKQARTAEMPVTENTHGSWCEVGCSVFKI